MKIVYLQENECIPDKYENLQFQLENRKYSSFNNGIKKWKDAPLLTYKKCNFVGIVWLEDTMYLVLPKSIKRNFRENWKEKFKTLLRYAKLFDRYQEFVTANAGETAGSFPSVVPKVKDWICKVRETNLCMPEAVIVAAEKFENVFEWMIGEIYGNQIEIRNTQGIEILFDSKILGGHININKKEYAPYSWKIINKRKNGVIEQRQDVFGDQEKRNIPDIVYEKTVETEEGESKDYCVIIDAKYSGWNENDTRYKLPGNPDIYKQFFYQEQFRAIYRSAEEKKVEIFNCLILPDYLEDTDSRLVRMCAYIQFQVDEKHVLSVWQIDTEKLIRKVVGQDATEEDPGQELLCWLIRNAHVEALHSR